MMERPDISALLVGMRSSLSAVFLMEVGDFLVVLLIDVDSVATRFDRLRALLAEEAWKMWIELRFLLFSPNAITSFEDFFEVFSVLLALPV